MFGNRKFAGWMRHPGFNKKDSEAPDYQPVADASAEAAKIMGDLGQQQLDFSKQQYDEMAPYLMDIANAQLAISEQTAAQGQDYYDYQKSFRPVEQQMLADAMVGRDGEIAAYDAANQADAAAITSDPNAIYNQYRGEIDNQVGQAVADSQGAYTRNINQAIRQGLRYGAGTSGIIANVANIGLAQAQQQAAAANGTRNMAIDNIRGRIANGLQMRHNNMNAKNAQNAIDWAKQLDAAGLVKGMAGASQGAYGLAINAGNSAGQNAMAPGSQYMAGMQAGASTIGSGQQMKIGGLSNVLNAQTSVYNNSQNQGLDVGGLLSGGAAMYTALS